VARPLKPLFDQEEVERFIKPTLRGVLCMYTAGGNVTIKTSEEDYLRAVLAAEKLVLRLSHFQAPPDFHTTGHNPFMNIVASNELVELGGAWKRLHSLLQEGGNRENRLRRTVLPRIMAFHQAFEPLMGAYSSFLSAGGGRGLHSAFIGEFEQLLNQGFEDFQQSIRSTEVVTGTKRLQTRMNRNRLQQQRYVDSLLDQYHSLYSVYLDLGYDLRHPDYSERRGFDSVQQDFKRFMKERRHNPLWKDDLVGYLWKLSDGVERGYHYHLILLYRGESESQHSGDKQKLFMKWVEDITEGAGARFEQILPEDQQGTLLAPEGIVSREDSESYERLVGFIRYLNKLDYLIQLDVPKGGNVYGRGQIPT
jgi:hypothetical protein